LRREGAGGWIQGIGHTKYSSLSHIPPVPKNTQSFKVRVCQKCFANCKVLYDQI
jgi:hypothetical protein